MRARSRSWFRARPRPAKGQRRIAAQRFCSHSIACPNSEPAPVSAMSPQTSTPDTPPISSMMVRASSINCRESRSRETDRRDLPHCRGSGYRRAEGRSAWALGGASCCDAPKRRGANPRLRIRPLGPINDRSFSLALRRLLAASRAVRATIPERERGLQSQHLRSFQAQAESPRQLLLALLASLCTTPWGRVSGSSASAGHAGAPEPLDFRGGWAAIYAS